MEQLECHSAIEGTPKKEWISGGGKKSISWGHVELKSVGYAGRSSSWQ